MSTRWLVALVFIVAALAPLPAASQELCYPHASDQPRSRSYSSGHMAIDFAATCGVGVYAAKEGVVSAVVSGNTCRVCYDCYSGCGNSYVNGGCKNNYVYIDHPDGYQTRYLHLQRIDVGVGQQVQAGQQLGETGNVGWTCGFTGCHLHFELRDGARAAIDPDAGRWRNPLCYGGQPPRDTQLPVCEFPQHPGTRRFLSDAEAQVDWRVSDGGGSRLRGASQSWDTPIDPGSNPSFDFSGSDSRDGYLKLGWAGAGRHTARVRAWDGAGNTCDAELGPFWFYTEPFERDFLLAGPFVGEEGERDRLADAPLGDEAALVPRPGVGPWVAHQDEDDHVDLDALLGGDARIAYAATWCYNPGALRPMDVYLGSDDGFQLQVNGQLLASDPTPRGAEPDANVVRAELRPGWNLVLLKVEEKGGGWGFYLRLAGPDAPYQTTDVACMADFSLGPCDSEDDACPMGTVCREGHCLEPLPEPEPGADAGVGEDVDAGAGEEPDAGLGADAGPGVGEPPGGSSGEADGDGAPAARPGDPVLRSTTCAQAGPGATGRVSGLGLLGAAVLGVGLALGRRR